MDYYNGASKDYQGDCCDNPGWLCLLKCDNWFKICLTTLPVSNRKKCIYSMKTKILGNDKFDFPRYGELIGKRVKNPIKFTYDGSFVSFFIPYF